MEKSNAIIMLTIDILSLEKEEYGHMRTFFSGVAGHYKKSRRSFQSLERRDETYYLLDIELNRNATEKGNWRAICTIISMRYG